jgi:hypothetical protein
MTKKEFMGFSSAAQHDMVLEALVRVIQNLETMEKESGKPFVGTVKQRRNDIKLLTILAEAFGKNELVWVHKPRVTVDAGKYMPDKKIAVVGVGMERYNEKSMAELSGCRDEVDAEDKIEGKVLFQRYSGNFKGCVDCKEVAANECANTGIDWKEYNKNKES